MVSRRHIINSYAWGLLLVFVSFYANTTLFQHSHIINGVTIVHSHIHGSSHHSSQNGGHSSLQVTLISHLVQFDASNADAFPLPINAILPSTEIQYNQHIEEAEAIHLRYTSLRAPPSYFI